MENEWVPFLNIIGLSPVIRRKAKLDILLETNKEIPDESFINELVFV